MSHLKPPVGKEDHRQGPADASIVLVEYGDFQCPYCGQAYPELKAVQKAMGDKLCFVFRHFPLSQMHPHAQRAAEFSEAAATLGRFWEMHDLLYENQQALDDRSLVLYAGKIGMQQPLIESAFSGHFAERVARDFRGGVLSGVNGTPCLFVNGERVEGAWDAASLVRALSHLAAS